MSKNLINQFQVYFSFFFLLFSFTVASSHPGHSHKVMTEKEILTVAEYHLDSLVREKKIAKDWIQVSEVKVEKMDYEAGPEWRVDFYRPWSKRPEREHLYIFLSIYGQYLAANYTGK